MLVGIQAADGARTGLGFSPTFLSLGAVPTNGLPEEVSKNYQNALVTTWEAVVPANIATIRLAPRTSKCEERLPDLRLPLVDRDLLSTASDVSV